MFLYYKYFLTHGLKFHFLYTYFFVTDVHSSRERKTVLLGTDLLLQCPANDVGPETGLNWMRVSISKTGFSESKLIYRDDSSSLFTTDSRFQNFNLTADDRSCCNLLIDRIELEDEGNYTCQATGEIPHFYIEVLG